MAVGATKTLNKVLTMKLKSDIIYLQEKEME